MTAPGTGATPPAARPRHHSAGRPAALLSVFPRSDPEAASRSSGALSAACRRFAAATRAAIARRRFSAAIRAPASRIARSASVRSFCRASPLAASAARLTSSAVLASSSSRWAACSFTIATWRSAVLAGRSVADVSGGCEHGQRTSLGARLLLVGSHSDRRGSLGQSGQTSLGGLPLWS